MSVDNVCSERLALGKEMMVTTEQVDGGTLGQPQQCEGKGQSCLPTGTERFLGHPPSNLVITLN
jgi:hypothetical protein